MLLYGLVDKRDVARTLLDVRDVAAEGAAGAVVDRYPYRGTTSDVVIRGGGLHTC